MSVKSKAANKTDIDSNITTNGNGDISGDDLNNILKNIVDSYGDQVWIKITKTYTDFSIAGTSKDIEIYSLPAKGFIHGVAARQSASFKGGSIGSYVVNIGTSGGEFGEFLSSINIFADPTDKLSGLWLGQSPEILNIMMSFSGATSIRAQAIADQNLNAATSGSIDIWLLVSILP